MEASDLVLHWKLIDVAQGGDKVREAISRDSQGGTDATR
jgi:hypothetical protein